MEKLSDKELAARAKASDAGAFEALIERHYMMMYKVAYKWCGSKEDAEDIAQEVSVKLARVINLYEGDSAFTTWLYPVILNTAKDMMRKRGSDRARDAEYVKEQAFEPAPASQERQAIEKEAFALVDTLPDGIKDAVLLVLAEGLSHKQAAEILGCAESTVSWRLHEAKKLLAKKYGKEG